MVDETKIQLLKARVLAAKDRFAEYLELLSTPGTTRVASSDEKDIFNLTLAYSDGKLSRAEILDLKANFRSLDTNKLIDDGIINETIDERIQINSNAIDLDYNNDGNRNFKDIQAVDYVLNFSSNNIETLDQILGIAGNESKITEYYVKKWAGDRNLKETSPEYQKFYDKFYTGLYKNGNPKATNDQLKKIISLYDAGLGKTDMKELDDYWSLVVKNVPQDLVVALFRFERSDKFDVVDKKASLRSYVSILTGNNIEQKNYLGDAIKRKFIPITNEPLTAKALDAFLTASATKEAVAVLKISAIAKGLGLKDQAKLDFEDKFFNNYYGKGKNAVDMQGLNNLANLYKVFRSKNKDFTLDMLDEYANAAKKNIATEYINAVAKFELSPGFKLPVGKTRSESLKEIFDIFASTNTVQKQNLIQAFKYGKIPLTNKDLTLENIFEFIYKVTDEKSYIETQVDIWAKEENLSGTDKEIFAVKFNDYYKKFKGDTDARSKLNTLFQMHKSKKVDFDKLEIYATAFDKNASIANIKSLDNFQQAQKLSKEQLQQLTDALTGNNSRQKAVVEAVLKSGRLPYNSEEATSLKLFKMLEDVKEKSGEDKLLLEHYAVLAGIDDGAKKTAFIQKLSEWSVNKKIEVPKLRFLGDFYKAGMKFDELEVLVDGAKANIDVKDLKVIAAYAIKEKINKTDLAKYSAILAGTNANAKRILIDSIKLNRIPITGEELTQTKLEQVLDKVKTEAGFFDLQIDQWVKNLDTTKRTVIKEKLTKYKNDLKLTIPQLGNLVSLNSTYPFQRLDDMDAYADALKKQVKFGQLNAVADFLIRKNTTINATTRTEKTNQYLSILSSSDPTKNNQKQILQNAISRGMISLTGKEATIANIDEALTASNNEQSLTEFSLKQIAKDKGLREGGVKYEEFMRKYYTDLYQGRKLKIGEIRFIISIDSKGIFGDSNLTNLVKLMKSQDGTGLVSRLERFATSEGLTRTKVSEYLAILSGSPSPKRDMLIQALNSKFVPISNTRLY